MSQQVQDPVCGMMVDPKRTTHTSEYQGETYHFCSADCKKAFDAEPQRFAKSPDPRRH